MEVTTNNDVKVRELFFTDEYFPRVTERLQIMLNCIVNKIEIQDSDYEVLQEVHKWFMDGKFGWSKPLVPEIKETITEIGLFDTSDTTKADNFDDARDQIIDGIDVVKDCSETNKIE